MNGGKIKKGNYKDGRGYSGWYKTKYNKSVFLRSIQEFIFAKKLDFYGMPFLMEQTTFKINNKTYKPDFFIYQNDTFKKLIKIIELKCSEKEIKRYNQYKEYFNKIGIEYEIVVGVDTRKNYEYCKKTEMDEWRNNSINCDMILSGKKNPMFGIKHSDETKQKIGNKTRQYMKDIKIKEKHSNNIKAFWNSSAADEIKEKYRKLRIHEKIEREKIKNIENPIISCICINCKQRFEKRKLSKKITCSASCSQQYNWKIGKNKYRGGSEKSYRSKIKKYFNLIDEVVNENNYNEIIQKYKNKDMIPKHFGMSLNIINKYFGNLRNLSMEKLNG